jgi:hypothetical protein
MVEWTALLTLGSCDDTFPPLDPHSSQRDTSLCTDLDVASSPTHIGASNINTNLSIDVRR